MDILLIMTGRQNVWLAISGTMMLANIIVEYGINAGIWNNRCCNRDSINCQRYFYYWAVKVKD